MDDEQNIIKSNFKVVIKASRFISATGKYVITPILSDEIMSKCKFLRIRRCFNHDEIMAKIKNLSSDSHLINLFSGSVVFTGNFPKTVESNNFKKLNNFRLGNFTGNHPSERQIKFINTIDNEFNNHLNSSDYLSKFYSLVGFPGSVCTSI